MTVILFSLFARVAANGDNFPAHRYMRKRAALRLMGGGLVTKSQVSMLLQAVGSGDEDAYDQIIPLIYEELERMARSHLRGEHPDHTLQTADLVADAYLRLTDRHRTYENRSHFFGAAAIAMRRVLVDHARRRAARKRGGHLRQVTFEDMAVKAAEPSHDVLALDDALETLAGEDERLSKIVHLRYFVGLTVQETADLIGVSPATVKRDWAYARAWLSERMSPDATE
jgi:RNA polymerase sigma-70 factor (ECF subfamily)